MRRSLFVCVLIFAITSSSGLLGVQLAYDPAFQPALTQVWNNVTAFSVAPNSQIYLSGAFDYVNGVPRHNLVRLHSDGSVDPSFSLKANPGQIRPWLVQSEGKLLASIDNVIRWINPDGTLPEQGPRIWVYNVNFGGSVEDVRLLANGKILVGGSFFWAGDGFTNTGGPGLIRLNPDATIDTGFRGPNGDPFARTLSSPGPNETVFLLGTFRDEGGNYLPRLVRLRSTGAIDPEFSAPDFLPLDRVFAIEADVSGKLWVAGQFNTPLGFTNLVRLNSDGSADTNAIPLNPNSRVRDLQLAPDGSMMVFGAFTFIGGMASPGEARVLPSGVVDTNFIWGSPLGAVQRQPLADGGHLAAVQLDANQRGILKLNPDGSLDQNFQVVLAQNGLIQGVYREADGHLLVITHFARGFDPAVVTLSRVRSDGSLDPAFIPQLDLPQGSYEQPTTVTLDSKGRILVGLLFADTSNRGVSTIIRLDRAGRRDTTFTAPLLVQNVVSVLSLQPDEKVLVGTGGVYTSGPPIQGDSLFRLHTNGARDISFSSPFTNISAIHQMIPLPDGQLIVKGFLRRSADDVSRGLARLETNGAINVAFDATTASLLPDSLSAIFSTSTDGYILRASSDQPSCFGSPPFFIRLSSDWQIVYRRLAERTEEMGAAMLLDQGDRLIVQGRSNFARLRQDGTLDDEFGTGAFFKGGYIVGTSHVLRDDSGGYILAGDFVIGSDLLHRNLVRLTPTAETIPPLVRTLAVTASGSIVLKVLTAPGQPYVIQKTATIGHCSALGWQSVTNFLGNGQTIDVLDTSTAQQPFQFYRLTAP